MFRLADVVKVHHLGCMNETEIARILREHFDGVSQVDAAEALGVDRSNLPTKLIGEKGPYYTIKLAHALKLGVLDTMVRAGHISAEDIAAYAGTHSLSAATDVELSQEIVNRVRAGGFHAALTDPVDQVLADNDGEQGAIDISGALDATAEREPRPDR